MMPRTRPIIRGAQATPRRQGYASNLTAAAPAWLREPGAGRRATSGMPRTSARRYGLEHDPYNICHLRNGPHPELATDFESDATCLAVPEKTQHLVYLCTSPQGRQVTLTPRLQERVTRDGQERIALWRLHDSPAPRATLL